MVSSISSLSPVNSRERFSLKELRDVVMERAASPILIIMRGAIPQRSLQTSLTILKLKNRWVLWLPQYWAVYAHDGRGPVRPRGARVRQKPPSKAAGASKLRYFPDKTQDPRTDYGRNYPSRLSDIRYLTPEQLKTLRGAYVETDYIGPMQGTPFFEDPTVTDQVERWLDVYTLGEINARMRRVLPDKKAPAIVISL